MNTFVIKGANYFGYFKYIRTACRALIIKEDKVLTSFESASSHYMLPGGGLEEEESNEECIIREVEEETGYIIKPCECQLIVEEYYEDTKYVSYYFLANIVGEGRVRLTSQELKVGLKPIWINKSELINIFSKYNLETIEEWRGLYQREYVALTNLIDKIR